MYARRGLGMGRPFPNVQAWGRHCADNNAGAPGMAVVTPLNNPGGPEGTKDLLQGDGGCHVGRPCEVSLAPPRFMCLDDGTL